MTDKITFGDLHSLLTHFGFERKEVRLPFIVFEHKDTGALQAFRMHLPIDKVDPMNLASVRSMLVNWGFVERDEFERELEKASLKGASRARRK